MRSQNFVVASSSCDHNVVEAKNFQVILGGNSITGGTQTVLPNERNSLVCSCESSPKPVVSWFISDRIHGSKEVYAADWMGSEVENSATGLTIVRKSIMLDFAHGQNGDNGKVLSCRVHVHEAFEDKYINITLNVEYPPTDIKVTSDQGESIPLGEKMKLTCQIDANPPPSRYEWSKEPYPEAEDLHRYNFDNQKTFELETKYTSDSGNYTCKVTNSHGSATGSINIYVIVLAVFEGQRIYWVNLYKDVIISLKFCDLKVYKNAEWLGKQNFRKLSHGNQTGQVSLDRFLSVIIPTEIGANGFICFNISLLIESLQPTDLHDYTFQTQSGEDNSINQFSLSLFSKSEPLLSMINLSLKLSVL